MPTIVIATPTEQDRTLATLGTAFVADPLVRWLFPEPGEYLAHFISLGRFFAGRAFEHGAAYRSDDFMAAALWLPPGVHPDEESMGALMASALPAERHEEVFGLLEQVSGSHPEQEHWYLPAIGVDPRCQGGGYGSALLQKSLEACDRTHTAAYLEASTDRSLSLYQRFGFEAIGRIQQGSSPTIVPMLRSAR